MKYAPLLLISLALVFASSFTFHSPGERATSFALAVSAGSAPVPLLAKGHPVNWWFVFKLNAGAFPDCGEGTRGCPFGGTVKKYKDAQQYLFASNESPTLKQGSGCVGDTDADPIGATFDEVYSGSFNYLIWNDQFYDDPEIKGCEKECGS